MPGSTPMAWCFEGYGPVGELRSKDLAGRPVELATFPGGDEGAGPEGLQTYIRAHREKDFLNNLSEKLLVYGLGRKPCSRTSLCWTGCGRNWPRAVTACPLS